MEPIKIYRTKNGTIITPYRKYQCRDLEHQTSIYDKVYHKSNEMTVERVMRFTLNLS